MDILVGVSHCRRCKVAIYINGRRPFSQSSQKSSPPTDVDLQRKKTALNCARYKRLHPKDCADDEKAGFFCYGVFLFLGGVG